MSKNKRLLETLHQEYGGMVLQLCLGYLKGDSELAKDLTQEVFINIWRALDSFKHASAYKTWIYRITVNTCLKYIRDKKVPFKNTIDEESILVAEEKNGLPDETFQGLYKAIGELKEVDRIIMMLVLEDLEYSEISRIIGIKEGNLRVKIHRIKKEIKKILEHEY